MLLFHQDLYYPLGNSHYCLHNLEHETRTTASKHSSISSIQVCRQMLLSGCIISKNKKNKEVNCTSLFNLRSPLNIELDVAWWIGALLFPWAPMVIIMWHLLLFNNAVSTLRVKVMPRVMVWPQTQPWNLRRHPRRRALHHLLKQAKTSISHPWWTECSQNIDQERDFSRIRTSQNLKN